MSISSFWLLTPGFWLLSLNHFLRPMNILGFIVQPVAAEEGFAAHELLNTTVGADGQIVRHAIEDNLWFTAIQSIDGIKHDHTISHLAHRLHVMSHHDARHP